MNELTSYDLWGVCKECKDQFSVFFWLTHTGNQVYQGSLERSSTYYQEGNQIYHRCGGEIHLYGPNIRVIYR